jgi:hypothetical protein
MSVFNGVKVISATMIAQRQLLGETVTQWLDEARRRPGFEVVDVVVTQSSDDAFHCIVATIFYKETLKKRSMP